MYLLHYAPDNASLVIRLVLEEAALPYRTALVDHAARRADTDGYRAINPTGLIPALETPQGILFETGAILLWLNDRHGLGPTEPEPARQTLLAWLFLLSNTLHADLRLLFHPDRYAPVDAMRYAPVEAAKGPHALTSARLKKNFTLVDHAAEEAPRLFAIGGVLAPYLACMMRWSVLYPQGQAPWFELSDYPALQDMARRLEARPATRRLAGIEGLGPTPFTAPVHAEPAEGTVR